jgi:hypothetical protein
MVNSGSGNRPEGHFSAHRSANHGFVVILLHETIGDEQKRRCCRTPIVA